MKIFNWVAGSFCRTLGRFLFYIAVGIIAMLLINTKAHAYVRIDTINETLNPTSDSKIVDPSNSWVNGVTGNYESDWLYSASHYWSGTSLYGNYLNVGADYYIGIETLMVNGIIDIPSVYLYTARNTLKAENLRCGIGSAYKSGYDATYAPVITNFKVETVSDLSPSDNNHDTIHITFNYSQQLSTLINDNESNMSCWFERSPSDGLFMQTLGAGSNHRYTYYIKDFKYSVSTDPSTGLLTDITSQNDTIIDQNQEIIDKQEQTNQKLDETNDQLEDLNSNLTNTDNPDLGALENSAGWLPAGPVDSILNLPLSLLENLTTNLNKSCQPVILPIPYVNKDLTLPCVNTLYDDMGISAWVTTIGVIASAFIMFSYLLKLYKWVDDTLSFRENNQIDNWGGI